MTGLRLAVQNSIGLDSYKPHQYHHTCSIAMLAVLLFLSILPGNANAQDGPALMQKMMAAYQHLSTYEGRSNVDAEWFSHGALMRSQSVSNQLQLKRPNKLALTIMNNGPDGTRSVFSDGTSLTVYRALPNRYRVVPTAPDMAQMVGTLIQSAGVSAELDPLYFFCLNKLPASLTLQKNVGSSSVNGHNCYVVRGDVPAKTTSSLPGSPGRKVNATATTHWSWYIDRQTLLLDKVEVRSEPVNRQIIISQKGKNVRGNVQIELRMKHLVTLCTPDPSLDDSVFKFKAPSGAQEQKSVDQILKGTRR